MRRVIILLPLLLFMACSKTVEPEPVPEPVCAALLGDVNLSGAVDHQDRDDLTDYVFLGTPEPVPCCDCDCSSGDYDRDGAVNMSDIVALISDLENFDYPPNISCCEAT